MCELTVVSGRVCAELTSLKNTSALSVAFSARGDRVAYASADGTVNLYSSNLKNPSSEEATELRASAPAFQPSGAPVAASPARRPATAPGRVDRSSNDDGPVGKADLDELKRMPKPPLAIKLVGDAVCILFGFSPSWNKFKELVAKPSFLKEIREFDQFSIPPATVWKLQDAELLTMPEFQPDEIRRVSCAAHSLCKWVHSVAAAATGYTPTRQQRHASRMSRQQNNAAATAEPGAASVSTRSPLPSPKPQPSRPTSRSRIGGRILHASAGSGGYNNRIGGAGATPLSSPVKMRGDPALFGLGMNDIRELKCLNNPPAAVSAQTAPPACGPASTHE